MTELQEVKDVLGPDVAETLKQYNTPRWTIQDALTEEFTTRELNPPSDLDFSSATPNVRIGKSEPFWIVVRHAKHEYGMSGETEAIRKLLRFGISAVAVEYSTERYWLEKLEQANSILSQYIEGTTELASSFHQRSGQNLGGPNEGNVQKRILWNQKLLANKLSEKLDLKYTEIFHLAVLLSGRRLGSQGEIAEPGRDKINKKIEEFDVPVGTHKRRGYGAIAEALQTEHANEVVQELKTNCPTIWEEFINWHETVIEQIEESKSY